ncbi:NAD(P)H-hydrate dehydratase [Marinomonas piezotolerans]|nr:NAD(P)H-hydrate dehydratase [Marinomonas piezotolerans]
MINSIPTRYLTPLFDIAAIRRREQASFAAEGNSFAMMQRAGAALYQHILRRFPKLTHLDVVIGGGNNGGDGFIVAALAAQDGLVVSIFDVSETPRSGDAARAEQAALNYDQVALLKGVDELSTVSRTVIVDAVTGIGFKPPLSAKYKQAVDTMNHCRHEGAWIVSVDTPSGLNACSGIGSPVVHADLVVSFIADKIGHYLLDGSVACHDIVIETLQAVDAPDQALAYFVDPSALEKYLPCSRLPNSHKGTYGHVAVIGGDAGFGGAAIMASEASAKSGAGTVSLFTHERHLSASLVRNPNVMCLCDKDGALTQALRGQQPVVVIGPGLGKSAWSSEAWNQFSNQDVSAVIDADGLYWLMKKPIKRSRMVLTPHPGEAARLMGWTVSEVLSDLVSAAKRIAERYLSVVILKGATSVVASPSGQVMIVGQPCPGLAKGGSGDILSGIVGSCLAYYTDPFEAAVIAAAWHNKAGKACEKQVGAIAMQPYQLLDYLE